MSNYAVIVDVVFGMYLVNFIGALLNARFIDRPVVRGYWDIAIGVVLFLLVLGT